MTSRNTTIEPLQNGRHAKAQPSVTPRPEAQPPTGRDGETETPVINADAPADLPEADVEALEPEEKTPRKRRRPPMLVLALLGVGAIAGSIYGLRWWQYASTHEETDNAQLTGHVYQISSRIPGTVQQVTVDDNQRVQTGDLLLQIDPHDYQVKVQQAQAALVAAQKQAQAAQASIAQAGANAQAQFTTAQGDISGASASIADAQSALTVAQAGVPVAQSGLAQAQATLQKAQTDYARYESLYEKGAVSAQERDAARQAFEVAQAQTTRAQLEVQQAQARVNQAQEGVSKAQAQLQSSQGTLQQAQATGVQTQVNRSQYEAALAQIAEAQANLKQAQLQLSYTQVVAPASGTIGNKTVENGQQLQAGQPLMALVGDDLWVVANFKETQIAHMRPGEPVEVYVDALPSHTFTGKVESLSPASGAQFALLPPDNATGNFTKVVQRIPVRISLDKQSLTGYEGWVSPGMSATVSVDTEAGS